MSEFSGDIEKIISEMIIEEKVAQMLQLSSNATPKEVFNEFKHKGELGSYLHVLGKDTKEFYAESKNSRLKIPPIFGIDAVHGHALLKGATVFPSQLAMACSFDEELLQEVARVTATEVAADGLDWVFSPVLCLGRDLRWGRIDETFGEDALLASRLGAAMIRGYQQDGYVAACAKHYFGYGEATGGRDSYDTEITERKAREIFLKPFKAAVDAGCLTFMTAYGSIDGTPLTVSYKWLTEVLKEEFGFDGFVVTDWENYRSLVNGQKVSENIGEACVQGILAGNDMSMNSYEFYETTVRAVKQGNLGEDIINEAVRRILSVKARLGLLKDTPPQRPDRSMIGCAEHTKVNYKAAIESIVLLKNDGILPIKTVPKRIAVIGPNADDGRAQYGDWTYYSHPDHDEKATPSDKVYTVLRGIKERFPDSEIAYAKGCVIEEAISQDESDQLFDEALRIAGSADLVIVVLGDNLKENGEKRDRARLTLFGRQTELLEKLFLLGTKTITVLVNGKPLVLTEAERYSSALIETFNGGDMCGLAVADLLSGKVNFSGKLPISFPYDSAATPCYYNQYDYWHGGKYIDVPFGSPYPFGFGLSYSEFRYSAPVLGKDRIGKDEKTMLCVKVKNVSGTDGTETVQLYYKDKICKILTPVRTLLNFKRVYIPAGQESEVQFVVDPQEMGYYGEDCKYKVDSGEFELYVSGNGKKFVSVTLIVE